MRLLWLLLVLSSVLLFDAVLAEYDSDDTKPGTALHTSSNGTRMPKEVNLHARMGPGSACKDCPEKAAKIPLWVRHKRKKLRRRAKADPKGPSQVFHVKATN